MNSVHLARAITNTLVIVLFWCILLLSLFLRNELSLLGILFDVGKSLFVAGFAWLFLIIIMDTLVKSMMFSAQESKYDRYEGGVLYHLTEPSVEEISWQKKYQLEHPELFENNISPSIKSNVSKSKLDSSIKKATSK
jgi:hypothetical protein